MKYKKAHIAIIDYDFGNVYSVQNAIAFLGYKVSVSADISTLSNADALILPGVGAFEAAMQEIIRKDLDKILSDLVLVKKKPILGICLGMQLFASTSEENGIHKGLCWIEGNVKKIIPLQQVSVPHVGWNNINLKSNNILFQKLNDSKNFYFDHSYHLICNTEYISSTCEYGGLEIATSVQKDNIFGVQFHPEKSQNNGLKLFRSFIENI